MKNILLALIIFMATVSGAFAAGTGKAPAREPRIVRSPSEYEPAPSYVESAVCYMGSTGYLVSVPAGWEMDAAAAQRLEVCALFRPIGTTFDSAPAVIYPILFVGSNSGSLQATADTLMENTARRYRDQPGGSGLSVQAGQDVNTPVGTVATRYINNGPSPNEQEAVGYFAHSDATFAVILSSRTRGNRDAAEVSWREALKSIRAVRVPDNAPR